MKKRINTTSTSIVMMLLSMILFGVTSLAGCNTKTALVPEEIITNAMNAGKGAESYFTEGQMLTYENNKLVEESNIKEWHRKDNKSKYETSLMAFDASGRKKTATPIETIITSDGRKIIVYDKSTKIAMSMDTLQGPTAQSSFKERFITTLNLIRKTHDLSIIGDDKIGEMDTFHLAGRQRQKNTLIGDVDFWVDRKSWFVVKSSSETANYKSIIQYNKVDLNPTFADNCFDQKLPKGVKIKKIEDNTIEKTITLSQGAKFIGKPILKCSDDSGYKLASVKQMQYKSKNSADEVIQSYVKDGLEAFSMSASIVQNNDDGDGLELPSEQKATIRDHKGFIMEEGIRLLSWIEGNVRYSFMINDNEISIREAMEIIEKMKK